MNDAPNRSGPDVGSAAVPSAFYRDALDPAAIVRPVALRGRRKEAAAAALRRLLVARRRVMLASVASGAATGFLLPAAVVDPTRVGPWLLLAAAVSALATTAHGRLCGDIARVLDVLCEP